LRGATWPAFSLRAMSMISWTEIWPRSRPGSSFSSSVSVSSCASSSALTMREMAMPGIPTSCARSSTDQRVLPSL